MSRSNNTELINPSKRFYEWVGSKGCLKYFDKNKGEKGENVFVELPFTFLVLDKLATIKGYSDADESGFWSNEIRNIKTDPFTIRTKKGEKATGLYKDLAWVLNSGACYSQSVYIAFYDEVKNLQIGNFQIHGSAIGEWITFCKGKDIYKNAITISGANKAKKGATEYFVPVYKLTPVSGETEAKAIALDKELQEYLSAYFKRNSNYAEPIEKEVESKDIIMDKQREDIAVLEPVDSFAATDDLPF